MGETEVAFRVRDGQLNLVHIVLHVPKEQRVKLKDVPKLMILNYIPKHKVNYYLNDNEYSYIKELLA